MPHPADEQATPMNAQTRRIRETLGRHEPLATSRDRNLGQILCCEGCCCGRTDKGFPPLPRDWIKQQWKDGKLNKSVQLTISGCLGPCDLANVVCVVSPEGMQWLGGLQEQRQYHSLLDWANASRDAGVLLELPAELNRHRFERFAVGDGSLAERAVARLRRSLWPRTLGRRCAVGGKRVLDSIRLRLSGPAPAVASRCRSAGGAPAAPGGGEVGRGPAGHVG